MPPESGQPEVDSCAILEGGVSACLWHYDRCAWEKLTGFAAKRLR
jgi:hypothetical protein